MATEKVTPMILKVDLQCPCCYKKIKKTLCKFPQIRDQVYDEKNNQVAITVVCCSPEKIRDKLCCKGGKAIKSITIVEKPKHKEPEKPKAAADKPKELEKPKEIPKGPAGPEKPKEIPKGPAGPEKPKAAEKPKEIPKGPAGPEKPKAAEKPKGDGGAPPPAVEKPKEAPKPEPAKMPASAAMPPAAMQMMGSGPAPVHGVPSIFPYCGPTHDAYAPGPYYQYGYGLPPPSQPMYEGYYGPGHGNGYGYGYGHGGVAHAHAHTCVNKNDNYFSDENPQTCTIM